MWSAFRFMPWRACRPTLVVRSLASGCIGVAQCTQCTQCTQSSAAQGSAVCCRQCPEPVQHGPAAVLSHEVCGAVPILQLSLAKAAATMQRCVGVAPASCTYLYMYVYATPTPPPQRSTKFAFGWPLGSPVEKSIDIRDLIDF